MHNALSIPLAGIISMPGLPIFGAIEVPVLLIPLSAIFLGCGIPLLWIYTDYRKQKDIFEMHHRERMAAIEKGIPVPPLPEGLFDDLSSRRRKPCSPASALLKGLIWLFLGISIFVAVWTIRQDPKAYLGLIPASIGLAYLVFYGIEGRNAVATPSSDRPDKTVSPS